MSLVSQTDVQSNFPMGDFSFPRRSRDTSQTQKTSLLLENLNICVDLGNVTIHQLFEQQVKLTPNSPAIAFEQNYLTYQELDHRANQLAHYLKELGVGPDVLVGICVERSLEMVIGLLGILKAGGAYVPLDPAFPQERLALMLEDAQPPVLLTQASLVKTLPSHPAQVVCLDADWKTLTQSSTIAPNSEARSHDLAYVIYTSGSTGKPKGVQIQHGAVVNFLSSMSQQPGLSCEDVLLAVTTLSFDIAVLELFLPLVVGARVVIASREIAMDGTCLSALLMTCGVTVMQATPATWRLLLKAGWQGNSQLKILCGGEALPRELANQLLERSGSVWNVYGPTETTIWSTLCQVCPGEGAISIGQAIANTQLYLFDDQLQPVAAGEIGELYIGGAGLARGYLNRSELTHERFIPNPFWQQTESNATSDRLYRTGDLARCLPDGNLECMGRIDHQVKIRGYRIELGEIEAVLWQYPDIHELVVVAREDVPGDQRLVAYVVLKPEAQSANPSQQAVVAELRRILQQKLPAYMVPSSVVILDALPLTPNGKIDRRALPAPDRTHLATKDFVAPHTSLEQTLTEIWAEVLHLEHISIDDNFLELGGHSLLATQVIARIRDVFHIELPLRCLFEAPTIAALAEQIALAVATDHARLTGAIAPRRQSQMIPLSCMQKQLWFLDQLVPNHPFYNVPEAIRLDGLLDIQLLEQSLHEIVRRHEALRTTFALEAGTPVQIVHATATLQCAVIDLQHLPAAEREEQAQQQLTLSAQQPFDLAHDALMRSTLIQLSESQHILLLNLHHTICDEWSFGILWQELATLYTAFAQGQAAPLPLPTIQYADFAIWQQQWLQESVCDRQLAYWQQQLQGHLPILQLPADQPRPAIPTYAGARHFLSLSESLTEKLNHLSRREGATLFMTLLAAFQTLLFRYTGQEDMLIGSPIANRQRSEVEGTIGFFVNTLVFRTDLSGSPSFQALLHQVREIALDAYAHQDLPFEQLVQALQPDRTLNQNPLFQVMFNLQNIPLPSSEIPDLSFTRVPIDNKTAKFDLFLELTETTTGLAGYFEYSTDLFEATTIARLVEQFQTLLEGIVTNPHQSLSELPLLPESEQAQLERWNNTQVEYPQQCVHQLVEAQVERTPAAIALVFEEQQLTYRALNDRANQLAHYLQSLGVAADIPVGLCVERSIDLVIGVLGILKAGGAYVPLDPAYPQERLTFMLENADAAIVVTQQALVDTIFSNTITRVCLDRDWEIIAQHSMETPNSDVTLDHLAYVIYTSGSTGKPKGVAMPHRPLTNLLTWQMDSSALTAARTLQFTPISFDVSFQEIFATLGAGGTLILIADDTRRDAVQLLRVLQDKAVERLFLPFVALQHLAEVAESEGIVPSNLREVMTAGEQLRITPAIAKWFSQLNHCTLHNHYGPSESHVVTALTLTGLPQNWATLPPIGQPIANTQIHLLDAQRQPVPIGVPGELYIGGASLARGYLNRPELTAERFIPNPFDRSPANRLYKTGDLARYLPDGNIEYLGRIDQQVKIRGFRIELGEVEAVLEQHSTVRETVAIAREDNPGEKRLVAYVVLQNAGGESQEPAELRRFLQTHLPEYMVPASFVFLDTLPLTPSGKVDRRSLPAPDYTRSNVEQAFAPPKTVVEKQLADLWTQVLKVDPIGIYDNFFDLGGHSLVGTLLVVKIREIFGVELALRRFFEIPTIAALAQLIESTQQSASSQLVKNSAIDLVAEAVLDPAIQTHGLSASIDEPTAILLTGASGFLGAFLLSELLQQTQADIYCLVRATTIEVGQQRLQSNLEYYSLWQEQHRSRIIPVIGDLAKPRFALSPEQFNTLACTIDVIYHNGGSVNFIYPYSIMKGPNVLGSQEVIRLASQCKIKPVHFVSTAGVFSPIDYADKASIYEQDEPDRTQGLYGYTQSKWVAEKLMVAARSRGIPTSIYRPFWVEGHSQTGVCNGTDFLRSLIKGCIQLGIAPDWTMRVDMLPADYLSQAIVHLSRQKAASGQAFHFSNPHAISWQQLVNWMRQFGYSLQSMPYEEWMTAVMAWAENDSENALHPFLSFFSEQLLESGLSVPDMYFKATPLKFDCQNTVVGLAGTSITCPPVDDQLLTTYFSSWIKSGFLKPPQN